MIYYELSRTKNKKTIAYYYNGVLGDYGIIDVDINETANIKPIKKQKKKSKKEYKMKIVTLLNYNTITGSLAGYAVKDVQETITPVFVNNALRKYQQTMETKRKMIAHQRTHHK